MSVTLIFLAGLAVIVGWWLSHQRLMSKPWLEEGAIADMPHTEASQVPAAKLGLGIFLAVVGALFAMLISAYLMRRDLSTDWRAVPMPPVLWVNTGLIVLSSVALHWAHLAVRHGDMKELRQALLTGGVSALGFLVGQVLAWRQLSGAGYWLATNPANTFFYLLTALHGLHVAGGLAALGSTTLKAWRTADTGRVRLSVDLCAIYWHFLLVVWLVLLALLMRWVDDFIEMCRPLLS
ncbi:cytochrome c oxidase subunit 3 [Phreatobacter stygius]|uniref:Cytochrome-c oxidase n=1 Tax=Phreatobacter stygius TaxID=1940610 RepID=A0A4D7B179_9HYPH|nr:cytochrome c oxidase subunit 3 [Phreatobacter stygius]QCI67374.1 cytochrome-c oxidase [Phreatobacter stygius]